MSDEANVFEEALEMPRYYKRVRQEYFDDVDSIEYAKAISIINDRFSLVEFQSQVQNKIAEYIFSSISAIDEIQYHDCKPQFWSLSSA